MVKQFVAFLAALFCLSQGTLLVAAPNEVQLPWSELAPLIVGEEVALILPGAVHIQGEVIVVRPEALEMEIKKTTDRRTYAKGQAVIPRSSVSVIELRRMRRRAGRIIGTVVGLVGGGIAGFFLADRHAVERKNLVHSATAAGATALGYYLGHVADRETTVILIVPEAP